MSQNLIDLQLDAAALQRVDAAITQLETDLAGLVALTPELRRELTKMGDKSEAFCRRAVDVLGQYPDVLPRKFDLEGFRRDLAMLDALRERMVRLSRLYERGNDTQMALGSDLMTGALEAYAFLKVAGKGEGLDEIREQLSARFKRKPKEKVPEMPRPQPLGAALE